MRKITGILILTAVAVFCATQIEADLTLRNGAPIRVAVPKGAFRTIDEQKNIPSSDLGSGAPSPKKAKTEENIRAAKCEFENILEYEQFRKLWDIGLPALSSENSTQSQNQTAISAELFVKCMVTAKHLGIQGEYAERFAENMVKYGLLGAHSADIMKPDVLSTYDLPHDTFWSLLQAFVRQMGFEYRITHPTIGQTMLEIERTNPWVKKINKEYKGSSQTTKIRTVLYSELRATPSQ
ncbi:hypothetical protein NECID01_2148, partial [Nematocida sp. AWRm77]